jgi:predicted extracellular nuclease
MSVVFTCLPPAPLPFASNQGLARLVRNVLLVVIDFRMLRHDNLSHVMHHEGDRVLHHRSLHRHVVKPSFRPARIPNPPPMTRFLRCLFAFLSAFLFVNAGPAFASSNGLVISQLYGGGGNATATFKNDFIEIFNASGAAVSLNGLSVQYASATGTTWQVTTLTGTLQAGQYYLIQESQGAGGTVSLPTPDATGTGAGIAMSATAGKVALASQTTALSGAAPTTNVLDIVSFGAATPTEGSPTPTLSNTTAVLRNQFGCTDTNSNSADFTVAAPAPRNTASPTHNCTADQPIVTNCPPFTTVAMSNGTGSASATDPDSIVTSATISGQPAGITLGAFTAATAVGGTATQQVSVASTVPLGSYTFQLNWANNTNQTATCNITANVAGLTAIHDIQGSGATSPLVGQAVVAQGVVTRTTNTGFYMQTPDNLVDADPNTSEGIFVFTSTAPTVSVGDLAQVSATVSEFNTGAATNTDTATHTTTELSSVASVSTVGTGFSVTPIVLSFPLTNRDDLEKYEHMLVVLNGPFTVEQNFFLGRFGQLTVAAGGRVETPTNRLRPGDAANALYADNKRRSIVIEDGTTVQDPNPTPFLESATNTVRAGDSVPSLTGVIDYGLATDSNLDPGSWRIVPTVTPTFTSANPRTTAPDDVGGTIRIASGNVDNFFTTFTNGQTADGQSGQGCSLGTSVSAGNCRGADSLAEFNRQLTKVVDEILGLNPDVMGIMELQNNSTSLSNGGSVGILVAALNAAVGTPTWAFVTDAPQGMGTDAIKVGMIYKPAKVTRVGASISDPNPIHNRAPMAQTFSIVGNPTQTFTLVVNHLRSKGCPGTGLDADQGDLQSCFNNTRLQQAAATRSFISANFAPTSNLLLVGDFNSYAMEDPIVSFTSNGYIDEIARFNTFGYSFQFDGSSGRLDHALTSPSMSSKIKRAIEWHINADEPSILDYNLEFKQPACSTCSPDFYTATPYRASDHDPIIIGVSFGAAPPPTTKGK